VDFANVFRLLDKFGYTGKCSLEFPAGEKLEDSTQALLNGMKILTEKCDKAAK